jgi:microsomal epoxide hydrolase
MRAIIAIFLLLGHLASAATKDRFFITSDHVRLHYIEAGSGHTVVLIPGWTMPAWIFQRQIDDLSRSFRVIAFDPRGQGDSAIPATGYDQTRRGKDIAELLAAVGHEPALIVAWSLGVLDTLAFVHVHGDARVAGLILVDNSVGEKPPPPSHPRKSGPKPPREAAMRDLVHGMFRRPQPRSWLDRLTATCLRTPPAAASALLAYPVPRSYWKEAVYATGKPVLYVVRPSFAGQAANLAAHHRAAESVVWRDVGHALFVDEPARFNTAVRDFAHRRIWK